MKKLSYNGSNKHIQALVNAVNALIDSPGGGGGVSNLWDGTVSKGWYKGGGNTQIVADSSCVYAIIPLIVGHSYIGSLGGTSVNRRRIGTLSTNNLSSSVSAIRTIGYDTDSPSAYEAFTFKAQANENYLFIYLNNTANTTGEIVINCIDITPA